ncbi:MAG: DUF4296 domain-containing protein [Bacteroidales bacterium]|nr:DUF4296 domain-containing protein [Bacteroidales bacterium]
MFLILSCSDGKKKDLDLPISEDAMVGIIKDMQKANYMIVNSDKDSLSAEQLRNDYKISICSHYNTDPQTYDSCLKIYLRHEDVMKRILEKAKQ